MLKKRLIFTLLYEQGSFVLSRNFRRQRIGDWNWLKVNYSFDSIAEAIDELVVLNVDRGDSGWSDFLRVVESLSKATFVPMSAGGGVRSERQGREVLASGADKIVVNTALFREPQLVESLSDQFGKQCIVGSIDLKGIRNSTIAVGIEGATQLLPDPLEQVLSRVPWASIGEVYLNSIDRDGTGQGLDFLLLDCLPVSSRNPVILAGGVGNARHLREGLQDSRVDAVATANLLNFVGDGFHEARRVLLSEGFPLPRR